MIAVKLNIDELNFSGRVRHLKAHGTLGGEFLDSLCLEAKLDCGYYGRQKLNEPLVNDRFSNPLRQSG